MNILDKIKEFEQRQAELVSLLQLLQKQGDNPDNFKRISKTNTELSLVCAQLSRLYAAIPLADKAKELLDSLPSVEEIKESVETITSDVAGKASGILRSLADKLGSFTKSENKDAATNELGLAFERIKTLLGNNQKEEAIEFVMKANHDKGINIFDVAVINTINTIEILLKEGVEEDACRIFASIYPA